MGFDIVLFDADGTLLDFAKAEETAFFAAFAKEGIVPSEEMFARYKVINSGLWSMLEQGSIAKERLVVERFERLFAEWGFALDPQSFNSRYLHCLSFGSHLIEGAAELLEQLHGKVRLAMVTNGVSSTQYRRLRDAGIDRYFEVTIVSEEAGCQKPDPAFFDYTFAKMGNPDTSRTLIVGDSLAADIRGGNNAGIATCWFNSEHLPPVPGLKIDYTVDKLMEIANIVL